jgi:FMN phosphatase YigB (HAD superfamily)
LSPGTENVGVHWKLIRTLIFDLGKVLIPFDAGRGYQALAPHCPLPLPEIRRRVASTDLVARFERGELPPEGFHRQFSELLGLRLEYARFCEAWNSIFLPDPLSPEETIERLHRLLALSNTNALHFEMVRERYGLMRRFDGYILSYEVGAQKPDPRMYQAALERAGCPPQECFYTDDIAEYVEAARRLGMEAVQFESAAQLERELRARGVEW